jgi:hypothetical protein
LLPKREESAVKRKAEKKNAEFGLKVVRRESQELH